VKHYEAMFVLHNRELPEEETATHEDIVRALIDKVGGTTAHTMLWANRKLAYPISGNQTGSYVLAYMSGPPEICSLLNREVGLSERCLRYMAFSIQEIPAEADLPGPLAEPSVRPTRPGDEETAAPKTGEKTPGKPREKKVYELLDYKNVYVLRRLVTSQGKLFSRVRSNLHAKHQRKLRSAVLRARLLALLPFVAR
jgi:small subunit ribosomal protein S18